MISGRSPQKSIIYEIKIMGKLDQDWSDWFNSFTLSYQGGETLLVGEVADQAALLGLLMKIAHLNLTLLSVHRVERHKTVNSKK